MTALRKILIVGGGTAGWLTAGYLARALASHSRAGVQIELVESSDIGILGVGEGTFPSIRGTLAAIGIDEAHFLRASQATFKQGIRFVDWVRPRGAAGSDHYLHPFNLPSMRSDGLELLPYWLLGVAGPDVPFAEAVTLQKRVADAQRAPKRSSDAAYLAPLNYAYHFDAACCAKVLGEAARGLGVQHRLATVEHVELDESGAISGVITREAGTLRADLYVDCTGLRAALIQGALGVPLRSAHDTLFVDRAVAIQVPYPRPDTPIPSYTLATAHEAGWTWDIPLHRRRGVGYVYSSSHSDDARAEQVLRHYIGPASDGLPARLLRFAVGYREAQWQRNCVAVGLAAGFIEPLESTGIGLIEMAAYLIAHLFPADGQMQPVARLFNESMTARYRRIIDFVKMHYCLSQRSDSRFWQDNTDLRSVPDTLQDKLSMWRSRPPHRLDFITDLEMFLPASWQYVLYGMEFRTELGPMRASHPRVDDARREFAQLRQVAQLALQDLPDHRALLDQVYAYGFVPERARA